MAKHCKAGLRDSPPCPHIGPGPASEQKGVHQNPHRLSMNPPFADNPVGSLTLRTDGQYPRLVAAR